MSTRKKLGAYTTTESLITKHRPRALEDVWGQPEVVKALRATVTAARAAGPMPHGFLFVGPSGTGKTTLARIMASALGCGSNVTEVDAATNTGIDAMRDVLATLKYAGFDSSAPNKTLLIDECHALSASAWQSMLKVLEEPPAHVFIMLCTTNASKVPATIVTRCSSYTLRELSRGDMYDFLDNIREKGDIECSDEVLDLVVASAEGSPRRALSNLQTVAGIEDLKSVKVLLSQPEEQGEIIELMRAVASGRPPRWDDVVRVLADNKDADPEGIRLTIVNYIAAVLMKSTPAKAPALLDALNQFMQPAQRSEKMAALLLAFGNLCFPPKGGSS